MFWTIFVILLVLWLLGFVANIGGDFIHLLLLVAVVICLARMLSGRKTA